jgi:hypothetical protein
LINKFTLEFGKLYCTEDGSINWNKLVKFNSSKNPKEFLKEEDINNNTNSSVELL